MIGAVVVVVVVVRLVVTIITDSPNPSAGTGRLWSDAEEAGSNCVDVSVVVTLVVTPSEVDSMDCAVA